MFRSSLIFREFAPAFFHASSRMRWYNVAPSSQASSGAVVTAQVAFDHSRRRFVFCARRSSGSDQAEDRSQAVETRRFASGGQAWPRDAANTRVHAPSSPIAHAMLASSDCEASARNRCISLARERYGSARGRNERRNDMSMVRVNPIVETCRPSLRARRYGMPMHAYRRESAESQPAAAPALFSS